MKIRFGRIGTIALVLTLCGALASAARAEDQQPPFTTNVVTGGTFHTTDKALQGLYDAAISKMERNVVQFTPSMKVLVEGGGYANAWIETQPMGGEMYAKRDVQVALNNQVVFMICQRQDGRMPGVVVTGTKALADGWDKKTAEGHLWFPKSSLGAQFHVLQGYCFPEPAYRMYFWAGKDKAYLRALYATLEAYDGYLWRTRDSNGDGILETWCVRDTGEDHSTRLRSRGGDQRWQTDTPPGSEGSKPFEYFPLGSMDIMAYSYSGRAVLAKIARELDNGKEAYWKAGAHEVRQRLIDKLWVAKRHACFDIDRKGRYLPELVHNNLRCMWYGIFNQEMADAFIKHHLLNPSEFWTPVPLVSIAVNEPLFRNGQRNDWSGPPQGLTYQRAIDALENYGHYAEIILLGRKLLPVLIRNNNAFTQQLDPFTGKCGGGDGYGPMILAALGYISRMDGIHLDVENNRVWWSALAGTGNDFTTSQRWGERTWTLECKDDQLRATTNGKQVFTASAGARIITDLDGKPLEIVGIDPEPQQATVSAASGKWKLAVGPNAGYRLDAPEPTGFRTAPFDYPYAVPARDVR